MIFRQLFDNKSCTYTYLLGCEDSRDAILIDPVFELVERDLALINELGLTLKYALDTHCHADHVTGSWLLKHYTECQIANADVIQAENTDIGLTHGDIVHFGNEQLEVRATPGHTDGCLTYVSQAHQMAFTGDALLIRGCGRCDFQQGDAGVLYDSVTQQILSLPEHFLLYPGHDYSGRMVTSVSEEKQHNVRLGGEADKHDFVGYMENMTLPHPKYIDIALPANLVSGKPEVVPSRESWAPLTLTFGGFHEVEASWVALNVNDVTLLDVREEQEHNALKVSPSQFIPLAQLTENISQIPTDKPVVVMCRSGRRSALAVTQLQKAGFEQVANVKGGILAWQDQGLPGLTASAES